MVTISPAQLGYLVGRHRLADAATDLAHPGGGVDRGIVNYGTILSSQVRRSVISIIAHGHCHSLSTDLASAHALIVAQRQALSAAEIRAAAAESEAQYRLTC